MWFTLESDPEIFTSLMQKMGASDLEASEVFDLDMLCAENFEAVGLVFLFKYARRNSGEIEPVSAANEKIFFVQQKAENSCATIAILNTLFNIDEEYIGDDLLKLKQSLHKSDLDIRGEIISMHNQLKKAHNSHVCEEVECLKTLLHKSDDELSSGDAFHYSALIPFNQGTGLIELDGLEKNPIVVNTSDIFWLEAAKQYAKKRMSEVQMTGKSDDVRFSLIAITPRHSKGNKRKKTVLDLPNETKYSHNYIPDLIGILKEISNCEEFKTFQ